MQLYSSLLEIMMTLQGFAKLKHLEPKRPSVLHPPCLLVYLTKVVLVRGAFCDDALYKLTLLVAILCGIMQLSLNYMSTSVIVVMLQV